MNWYRVVGTILIGSISFNAFGQASIPFSNSSYIVPYKLEVTLNKTTNLVFPAAIASVDRGSQDILVEKAVGVENILRVKAGIKSFEETNLSVITNDGKLYSFVVSFNGNPPYLNVNVDNIDSTNREGSGQKPDVTATSMVISDQNLKAYCHKAILQRSNVHWLFDESSKMTLALTGFYVKDNTMFCRLEIQNSSSINYDIEQFRFYIRDRKQSKRTASQEIEIHPLYIWGDSSGIKGNQKETLIIAVPKFTIPDGKFMAIEIIERSGGRHLALKVKNTHVVRAKSI